MQLRTDWSISASQTDVISNRWVNEFRMQYAPQDQEINSLDPLCGGPCLAEDQGGPTLEITGFASVGRQRFTPNPRRNRRLQFAETISFLAGSHHLKAGLGFSHIKATRGALPLHFGGRYIFSAIPALDIPSGLAAFQANLPSAYVQGYGNSVFVYPAVDFSVFVQDEWRMGRFVLKPGLRYDRVSFGDLQEYNISDVSGTRIQFPFPQDNNNIAPRVAAAYDVTGDGKTSIHGAYGLFYENTLGAIAGVTQILTGASTGVRTFVGSLAQSCGGVPCSVRAWNAPGRRLTEAQAASFFGGSVRDAPVRGRSVAGRSVRASGGDRCGSRADERPRRQRQFRLRARLRADRNRRLQPGARRAARHQPPPERLPLLRESRARRA